MMVIATRLSKLRSSVAAGIIWYVPGPAQVRERGANCPRSDCPHETGRVGRSQSWTYI